MGILVLFVGIAVSFLFSASCSGSEEQLLPVEGVDTGLNSITADELEDIITVLASERLEGRRSGTEESALAQLIIGFKLGEAFFNTQGVEIFPQNFEFEEVVRKPYGFSIDELLTRFDELGFDVATHGTNIVATLEGNEKKDEYIVIGAHYDHLGVQSGETHLGADDNASGTAAVIEIAEAFGILAYQGVRPQRSIAFVLFDAEEWGLWGSQYFVENPPFPFENIKAMVNLDMIGRNDPERLNIIGSPNIDDFPKRSPQLWEATRRADLTIDLDLRLPGEEGRKRQVFFRSDHASFFLASPEDNRTPVVFFSGGLHEDYHTPRDTADKINFEKVERVARFAFLVAWQLADGDETPVYIN